MEGQHGEAVVSTVASKQEDSGFKAARFSVVDVATCKNERKGVALRQRIQRDIT